MLDSIFAICNITFEWRYKYFYIVLQEVLIDIPMMAAKEKCESFEWVLEWILVHTNHAYVEESCHYLSCILNQFYLYMGQ